jgi:hypothetical protein
VQRILELLAERSEARIAMACKTSVFNELKFFSGGKPAGNLV